MKDNEITGVMVQYYMVCKRELWFYLNQVNMNYDNDDINIGRLIHENSYKHERKEFRVDNVVFDFVQFKDKLTVFEVKKSSKLTIGALYQLYYYLYILRKAGIVADGMLVYPKEKKRERIVLSDEIICELDEILLDILEIADYITPPKAEIKPFCRRCSFMELCLI
ncbi:CRISPR-associated protein Cas4 [Methanosphaera cuniculi]|uniref:CRISPR-associated protein Cas4 n=1 Tax=Methanosphaera cuniculi TaxID=1077256 RepID=UPI0026DD729C|nr:CRISPR-associated protein Cas4 [Methanosphaera cuniculi]